MWIGIEQKYPNGPGETIFHCTGRKIIGVVIRSARLKQQGHFTYARVSICGKEMWAGGAEDRIFPFHYVTLEAGAAVPRDMIPALGWCQDQNNYAFLYKNQPHIIAKAAVCGKDAALVPVAPENIPLAWKLA